MPVFNTEVQLLARSIESVLEQQYLMELIIIDDGSDETTAAAIDDFAHMHSDTIKVEHKKNGGVSSARNLALSRAKGDYVAFMDADDELAEGYLESAVSILQSTGADIVLGAVAQIKPSGSRRVQGNPELGEGLIVIAGNDIKWIQACLFDGDALRQVGLSPAMYTSNCGALFKRATVTAVRYNDNICISEDRLFNYDALGRAATVALTGKIWYLYHQNSESASNRLRVTAREDLLATAHELARRRDICNDVDVASSLNLGIIECFQQTIWFSVLRRGFTEKAGVSRIAYVQSLCECDVYKRAFDKLNPKGLKMGLLKMLFQGRHPLLMFISFYLNRVLYDIRTGW